MNIFYTLLARFEKFDDIFDARYEVFMVVKIQVKPIFRRTFLPPSPFHPEDGGSKFLRNVCILPQTYTAS
jgi:hypothetical protein